MLRLRLAFIPFTGLLGGYSCVSKTTATSASVSASEVSVVYHHGRFLFFCDPFCKAILNLSRWGSARGHQDIRTLRPSLTNVHFRGSGTKLDGSLSF